MSRVRDRFVTEWRQLSARYLPFADAATAELPMSRLMRLSLFQVTVGMAAVLLIGTLNRVMIVELGVPAWLVAVIVILGFAGSVAGGVHMPGFVLLSMVPQGFPAPAQLGPLMIGLILDLAGGMSRMAWSAAFLAVAALMLLELTAFWLMRPRGLAGDRGES